MTYLNSIKPPSVIISVRKLVSLLSIIKYNFELILLFIISLNLNSASAATSIVESSIFSLDLTGTPLLNNFGKNSTEDTPTTFAILDFTSYYIDPESAGLASIRIESLPAAGTLKLSNVAIFAGQSIPRASIGALVYEPAANDSGIRTFTVTASDGSLSSAPATVTLSIAAVADAPTLTAVATLTGAIEDTPFAISYSSLAAASNAADADGDPIAFRIDSVSSGVLTKAGQGVLAGSTLLSAGESLSWTPAANAFGTLNAFTIRAWDGALASLAAVQVKVEASPVNDLPTMSSVTPLTGATEDTPFTITYATLAAAANAADGDGDALSFRIEGVSSGTLTKLGAPAIVGSTLLSAGESVVWTAATNTNGQLSAFTVRAWDGIGASINQVTVAVSVSAVNDTPTLTTIGTLTGATEDIPFTVTYPALAAASNAADVETANLTFRLEAVSSGALSKSGTAAVPGATLLAPGESWTWTPSSNANGILNAFTVRAWDGTANSASAVQVAISVTAVNDAPTLGTIATLTGASEDTPLTITYDGLAAAADESDTEGDTIYFRIEAISTGTLTKGGAPVTPGNTLFGPGESLIWTPAPNATGYQNAFTVRAWDGTSASTSAIQVKVATGVMNDAPSLTAIATLTGGNEDAPYTVSYAALAAAGNASDLDGDAISFRIAAVSTGSLTKAGTVAVPGETLLSAGESVVWTPGANANGTLNAFTVVAWDGLAASGPPVQVTVSVTSVNDAPTLTVINPLYGATEDNAFTLSYATLLSAANAADVEGNALSFRIEAILAGSLAKAGTPVATGSTLLGSGESLTWTPPLNANGQINAFTVRAWDGSATSVAPVIVPVYVAPVNDAPVLNTIAPLSGAFVDLTFAITHSQLLMAANASDADGDELSFRLEALIAGSLTKSGAAATVGVTLLRPGESWLWTPPAGFSGNLNAFSLKAWDGTTASVGTVAVTITVADVRILSQPVSQSVTLGNPVTLSVGASGTGLSYRWYKGSELISGATAASYRIPTFSAGDAGSYAAVVTGSGVSLTSNPAVLTAILPVGVQATHALVGTGYVSGGAITITSTLAYPNTLAGLGWAVILPAGWSFASDAGNAGDTKPTAGAVELLEWAWTTIPSSPISFSYTLNIPAGDSGPKNLAALVVLRGLPGVSGPQQMLATPDPLVVPHIAYHDADTSRDFRIGLLELTRVIELFNTRNSSVRTGAYSVALTPSEDGYTSDASRTPTTLISLTRYHTADTDRNGRISLLELTRVIELYNYRTGTTRTGIYKAQTGSEDGFAPGP